MNRLDALRARVENMRNRFFTDAPQTFMSIDLRDVERLVAVVEAAQELLKVPLGENSLYDFKEDRLVDALAYWEKPEAQK